LLLDVPRADLDLVIDRRWFSLLKRAYMTARM
jgi:hypothetical protein